MMRRITSGERIGAIAAAVAMAVVIVVALLRDDAACVPRGEAQPVEATETIVARPAAPDSLAVGKAKARKRRKGAHKKPPRSPKRRSPLDEPV